MPKKNNPVNDEKKRQIKEVRKDIKKLTKAKDVERESLMGKTISRASMNNDILLQEVYAERNDTKNKVSLKERLKAAIKGNDPKTEKAIKTIATNLVQGTHQREGTNWSKKLQESFNNAKNSQKSKG